MLKLYNTLTRRKEDFTPVKTGEAKIYSCGPTVYSFQHIGNMRAAIFQDITRRTLKFLGYKVTSVQNITDVGHLVSDEDEGEDKMLKAAVKENKNPFEIAKFYTDAYTDDLHLLNVEFPTFMPKATEEIPEQIEIIKNLLKKEIAYKTQDGIYFDVAKFPKYGQLSGRTLEQIQENTQERIEENTDKHNPQDYALWKFTTGTNAHHIMKWDAEFGEGFPGWHIECSAMSAKYLGKEFDIHTGGIEHVPIHHENEIAQNTCSGCVTKVGYWIHNAHLQVDGEKMAKSSGTAYLLKDLIKKGYSPIALRELILRTHYRKSLNFTFESLDTATNNIKKINEFNNKLDTLKTIENKSNNKIENLSKVHTDTFTQSIEDDFNTPKAFASLYDFMSEFNKQKEYTKQDIESAKQFIQKTDEILGLLIKEKVQVIPQQIIDLANLRKDAKENKDWAKCDELRNQIQELGYSIKDDKNSKEGFIISIINK